MEILPRAAGQSCPGLFSDALWDEIKKNCLGWFVDLPFARAVQNGLWNPITGKLTENSSTFPEPDSAALLWILVKARTRCIGNQRIVSE